MTTSSSTLNVGVVGLGLAVASVIPAMAAMPHVNLVAGADVNPRILLTTGTRDEAAAKERRTLEAQRTAQAAGAAAPGGARFLSDLGLLVVS